MLWRDVLLAAVWSGSILWMFVLACALCRRGFPADPAWRIAGQALIVSWAWVVILTMALSASGLLSTAWLVATHLTACFVTSLALRRSGSSSKRDLTEPQDPLSWGLGLAWGGMVAIPAGYVVHKTLESFPTEWDALMYHIPLVDEWIQQGSLNGFGCPVWYNPSNVEVLGYWLAAPFSGDFWILLCGIVPTALLGFAVLEVAREAGLPRLAQAACLVAAVGTRITLVQTSGMKNDTAVAALFLAAIALGMRWCREGRSAALVLSAAACGLLAGIKYYSIGYAAVAAAIVVLGGLLRYGWRSGFHAALTVVLATALISGGWYVRNTVLTGSPVYPMGYSDETDRLADLRPNAFSSTLVGNGRISLVPQYGHAVREHAGAVQWWGVMALPALLVWAAASPFVNDGGHREWLRQRPLLAAATVGAWAVFAVTPFVVHPDNPEILVDGWRAVRFSQPGLILTTILAGMAVGDLQQAGAGSSRSFVRVLLLIPVLGGLLLGVDGVRQALSGFGDGSAMVRLMYVLDTLLAFAAVIWIWRQSGSRLACGALISLAAVGGAVLTSVQHKRWHEDFASFYDRHLGTRVFSRLEKDEAPPLVIGTLTYRNSPFYGSARQFRVLRPTHIASKTELIEFLDRNGVDVVAIDHTDAGKFGHYKHSGEWAREMTELVELERGRSFTSYSIFRGTVPSSGETSMVRNGGEP